MPDDYGSLLGRAFTALYKIPPAQLLRVIEDLERQADLCVLPRLEQDLDALPEMGRSAEVRPNEG